MGMYQTRFSSKNDIERVNFVAYLFLSLVTKMDPWEDRCVPVTTTKLITTKICPNYPQCTKDERKFLNEVRSVGKHAPANFKLSNGIRATDFCLFYIMKTHFKRKLTNTKT